PEPTGDEAEARISTPPDTARGIGPSESDASSTSRSATGRGATESSITELDPADLVPVVENDVDRERSDAPAKSAPSMRRGDRGSPGGRPEIVGGSVWTYAGALPQAQPFDGNPGSGPLSVPKRSIVGPVIVMIGALGLLVATAFLWWRTTS